MIYETALISGSEYSKAEIQCQGKKGYENELAALSYYTASYGLLRFILYLSGIRTYNIF